MTSSLNLIMSSAFDEAATRSNSTSTLNALHGKNLTAAVPGFLDSSSAYLTTIDKKFVEFRRNVLKSAGKLGVHSNNGSSSSSSITTTSFDRERAEIIRLLTETKQKLEDESFNHKDLNDKTLARLHMDFQALYAKFDTFCSETLDNPAFRAGGTKGGSANYVSEETDNSITIMTGNKKIIFKAYDATDIDLAIIEERDLEAQKILAKTNELNELFMDVSKLVDQQQDQIDLVDANVDNAQDLTKEGLGQLESAVRMQRSTGKIFCYFSVALLVIAGAVVGAIVLIKKGY